MFLNDTEESANSIKTALAKDARPASTEQTASDSLLCEQSMLGKKWSSRRSHTLLSQALWRSHTVLSQTFCILSFILLSLAKGKAIAASTSALESSNPRNATLPVLSASTEFSFWSQPLSPFSPADTTHSPMSTGTIALTRYPDSVLLKSKVSERRTRLSSGRSLHTEINPSVRLSSEEGAKPLSLPKGLIRFDRAHLFDASALSGKASTQQKSLKILERRLSTNNFCWYLPSAQTNCTFASGTPVFGQTAPATDPELGVLRLQEAENIGDPELGVLRVQPLLVQAGATDPELGTLRLEEKTIPSLSAPQTARQPSVYLLARVDYFKTSNVFSGVDPIKDGLIRSGLTLFYAPAIGPKTYLITSIDGNLVRYANLGSPNNRIGFAKFGSLNYNELRFRAGIWQQLSPRMSAEVGWSNQQLFTAREGLRDALRGDRFLNDHSIRLEISRQDPLSSQLTLNTFYQFRASFADPKDRDRLIHSFITSLSYSLSPSFQAALDYQLAWSHFTQQPRDDVYHQLLARLTYTVTPQSQFSVFSGFSFGNSSDDRVDFDGFIVGVGLVLNVPLF